MCLETQFVHFIMDIYYTHMLLPLYIKEEYTTKSSLLELLAQISHLDQSIFFSHSKTNILHSLCQV